MPIPHVDKPINRLIMREKVYQTLLDWIIEGVLLPGEKLLDKELAENLGVSRTPVREALRRLEDKDLVETSAGRWTRVVQISISEAGLIYPVMQALEELAVKMVLGHLKKQDFTEMEMANENLLVAIKGDDPVKASKADMGFHSVLARRTGNDYLIKSLQDLEIKYQWIDVLYFKNCMDVLDAVDEHRKIIKALKISDLNGAVSSMRENWQNSLKRLQKIAAKESLQGS